MLHVKILIYYLVKTCDIDIQHLSFLLILKEAQAVGGVGLETALKHIGAKRLSRSHSEVSYRNEVAMHVYGQFSRFGGVYL